MISFGLFEILKIVCRPPSLPSQNAGSGAAGLWADSQRGHTRLEGRQGGGGYGAASGQHGE